MRNSKNALHEMNVMNASQNLDHYLSDEEVVKAILHVMMKSRSWQDHLKQHAGAKLRVLATPGFEIKDNGAAISAVVSSLQEEQSASQVRTNEKLQGATQNAYAHTLITHNPVAHNAAYGSSVNLSVSENMVYGNPSLRDSEQQVIAGCSCGLVMDLRASGASMHTQGAATSKMSINYNMLQNRYVNADTSGSSGYGKSNGSRYATGF